MLVIILCLGLLSGCQNSSTSSATVLSTWTGTFAPDLTEGPQGNIINWEFRSDNTMAGNWVCSNYDAMSLSMADSSYTLDSEGNITGTALGTATNGASTSNYTLTVRGTLEGGIGAGSWSTTFSSWGGPYTGSWTVTKE
jgi:hypothetical protein